MQIRLESPLIEPKAPSCKGVETKHASYAKKLSIRLQKQVQITLRKQSIVKSYGTDQWVTKVETLKSNLYKTV